MTAVADRSTGLGPAAGRDVARLRLSAARARRHVLRMIAAAGAGHMGGAMSAVDVLTVLYGRVLRLDPADLRDPDRDRFLLSAGHKAMAQYAVLAEHGFVDEALLDTYGDLASRLPGHPDLHKTPGVEANTGALGHGLPIACGMALGARVQRGPSRVFTLLGDGELPEGSNWEGAAVAGHHGLDNLTAIVDLNGLQISGPTAQVLSMADVAEKFAAFGWATCEVDGNDVTALVDVLDRLPRTAGRPTAVVARTVKAAGVPGQEGAVGSHYWKPGPAELAEAVAAADRAVAEGAAASAGAGTAATGVRA